MQPLQLNMVSDKVLSKIFTKMAQKMLERKRHKDGWQDSAPGLDEVG